ncbi:hypothetical protein GCM10027446_15960 [Angustibacter peucedani]
MNRTRFDELFDLAAPLIRTQQHQRDTQPVEGGRWPVSVYLSPDEDSAPRIDELAREALALAGPGHFGTGLAGTSHFTVRALEAYRHDVPDDDPALGRYRAALRRTADRCRPVTLRLLGITLTPISVMLAAEPVDDAAADLSRVLREELGDDSRHEDGFSRDIWYSTLVHLAADVADPEGLVAWAGARRALDLGTTTARQVELARFRYTETVEPARMLPEVLGVEELAG